ncbi:MAG TPA: hypothetical protein VJT74_04820 [Pyrinomonadaceae bacterium]|nr:hypothetical protein [Pyrinomonadaceae bacterium]
MAEHRTTDANDFPEEFRKVEPIDVSVGLDPNTYALGGPRPDLNGSRIRHPAGAIYLILDGMRYHIPNPPTYNNLFRDWNGIDTDINVTDITDGGALSDGAVLAVQNEGGVVYLVTNGFKRAIISPTAMDHYHFSWERIVRVPRILLDFIQETGPPLS